MRLRASLSSSDFVGAARRNRSALALIVLLVATSASAATAFSVVENFNVDVLPSRPIDFSAGSAVLGENLVRNVQAASDNFDSFQIVVPEGLEITLTEFVNIGNVANKSAVISVFGNDGITVLDPTSFPSINDDYLPFAVANSLITLTAIGQDIPVQTSFAFSPGVYDVVIVNGGQISSETRFFATVVPEPSTALLIGLGLVVLGARRGDRCSSSC